MARASQNAGIFAIQGVIFPTMAAPAGLAVAAVGTGGTFAASTYFWKIAFVTPAGETVGSNEVTTAIVANGSANLTWTAPPIGTSAVKIFRGTATNAEVLVATVAGSAAAFTDTGPAQAVSGANTSGGTWFMDVANLDPTTVGAAGLATTRQSYVASQGTAAIPSVVSNTNTITIPTSGATAANYTELFDAVTGGNYRIGAALTSPVTATSIVFAVGAAPFSAS